MANENSEGNNKKREKSEKEENNKSNNQDKAAKDEQLLATNDTQDDQSTNQYIDSNDNTLLGGRDADIINGQEGNDKILGNSGNDTISGGSGDDTLLGESGDDLLIGGKGNDVISGDFGDATYQEPTQLANGNYDISKTNNFEVNFDSISSTAGYNNSFGIYFADSTGAPVSGQIIFDNVKDSLGEGDAVSLQFEGANIPEGAEQLGFFIIPNGDRINPDLENNNSVTFEQIDNEWTPILEGSALKGQGAPAFFSDQSLNPDGIDHMKTTDDGSITLGFEDLLGGGDNDMDDVNINFSIKSQNPSSGDDTLLGGSGDDTISGGRGDDNMQGNKGDDVMKGGAGEDTMAGGKGDDNMQGNKGDDVMKGGAGEDTMAGGKGDDNMQGGAGKDVMTGGRGDDTMTGGQGNDVITGGEGSDTAIFSGNIADYTITENEDGTYNVSGSDGTDVISGVENLQFDDAVISTEDAVAEAMNIQESSNFSGWNDNNTNTLSSDDNIGEFLGRHGDSNGDQALHKTFDISDANDTISIEFDMIEIDDWESSGSMADEFIVYVNDQPVSISKFDANTDDGATNPGGLENLGFGSSNDEVHHFKLDFKLNDSGDLTLLNSDGSESATIVPAISDGSEMKLGFGADMSAGINNESWGIDNINITSDVPSGSYNTSEVPADDSSDWTESVSNDESMSDEQSNDWIDTMESDSSENMDDFDSQEDEAMDDQSDGANNPMPEDPTM